MVPLEDAEKVHKVMSGLDYKVLKKDNELAIYASDVEVFGKVDFLFAHRKISLEMLKRAIEKPMLNGQLKRR